MRGHLGYLYVPPRQAPIDGSPEGFWDSAKLHVLRLPIGSIVELNLILVMPEKKLNLRSDQNIC